MQEMRKWDGITQNLMAFKEEVKGRDKVTFAGMPGVCSPFAELFAYVIRDKESVFIPGTDIQKAVKIKLTPYGMQLSEPADPKTDVLALLGGLTMPKANIDVKDVKNMIKQVLNHDGKLMGLCYNQMFQDAGWDKIFHFDCIINGDLTGYVLK